MPRLLVGLAALIAITLPATADAGSSACSKERIAEILAASGENTGAGIGDVDCGDVTDDGVKDAVFTVESGGTAGPTQFGVLAGGEDELLLLKDGYALSVDRVSKTRFDVQQPIYKSGDANCCPSAYRQTPYRFNGRTFKAGGSTRSKNAKARFFS